MTVMPVDGNTERVNVGRLCGENSGQHLYIHLARDTMMMGRQESMMMMMPVMIRFNFAMSQPYTYNIKVTQV